MVALSVVRQARVVISILLLVVCASIGLTACGGEGGEGGGSSANAPAPGPVPAPELIRVRQLGALTSVIADRILGQVHATAFTQQHDAPILLQGETLSGLSASDKREFQATY